MGLVVTHPGLVLDQVAHPHRGPQSGGISQRLRTALELLLDLPELRCAKFGFASGPASLLQARATCHRQLPHPANHRLAVNPNPARHLTLVHALLEQPRRFHPPLFQRLEVPPHTRCIAHGN